MSEKNSVLGKHFETGNKKEFKKWLPMPNGGKIKRQGTVNSYAKAIDEISQHYSENIGENVDIYKITDLIELRNICTKYDRNGIYQDFGDKNHGLYRAAIKAYVKFFIESKNINDVEKEPIPLETNNKKEFEEWMIKRYERNTVLSYKSAINTLLRHYLQQTNKRIDIYTINDTIFINGLVKDYGLSGKYKDIGENGLGENGNGNVRCAIAAYARFLEQKRLGYDLQMKEKDISKNNDHKNDINTRQQSISLDKFEITSKINMNILPVLSFMIILPSLSKYIGKILLKRNENNWWKKYVLDKLRETRNLPQNGAKEEYINELDISACLTIIIQNWDEIFMNEMDLHSRDLAHSLLSIRNKEAAHYTTKLLSTYNYEDVDWALNTIIYFMRPIDTNVADQISELKREFENKYKNE